MPSLRCDPLPRTRRRRGEECGCVTGLSRSRRWRRSWVSCVAQSLRAPGAGARPVRGRLRPPTGRADGRRKPYQRAKASQRGLSLTGKPQAGVGRPGAGGQAWGDVSELPTDGSLCEGDLCRWGTGDGLPAGAFDQLPGARAGQPPSFTEVPVLPTKVPDLGEPAALQDHRGVVRPMPAETSVTLGNVRQRATHPLTVITRDTMVPNQGTASAASLRIRPACRMQNTRATFERVQSGEVWAMRSACRPACPGVAISMLARPPTTAPSHRRCCD